MGFTGVRGVHPCCSPPPPSLNLPPVPPPPTQVINLDDVERILGERPFVSTQLRNIDRFRGKSDTPPSAPPPEGGEQVEAPATPTSGGSGGSGGEKVPASPRTPEVAADSEGGEEKGKGSGGRKVKPGSIVAT